MTRSVLARMLFITIVVVVSFAPGSQDRVASASTVFGDDFSSGTFASWSGSTNLTIDPSRGMTAPPSARAQTSSAPAYAYELLASPISTICASVAVNAASLGANLVTLLRLRTAGNGAIVKVFVDASGILFIKSDVSGAQRWSGVALGTGWHEIEACGTTGTTGTWSLYRDDVRIVTDWSANTGTTAIGRVEIGDVNARTFTVNFDDVVVSDMGAGTETDPPTAPGMPTGSSPTPGAITIQWAPSNDASPPITYRVYRDHGTNPIGTSTSTGFSEGGFVPGSSHVYAIDAVDSLGNPPSPLSPWSDPIVVMGSASTIFTDDFSSGTFANWSGATNLTIDPSSGGNAPPSARAQVTSAPAWAFKTLNTTLGTACTSVSVNLAARGSPYIALLRLRTAANGNIARVFVNNTGVLWIKSDVSGSQISSSTPIGTGYHEIELCGTVGAAGTWSLYRDGVPIVASWTANTGTTPIGRIEIGDNLAKTFTANFDDVSVTGPGGPAPTERPNILIFLTDDQRATDTMTPGVMPRLRQWVMQAGAQYTNFFATTPLCCPDRSVFLSGRYAHNTGVRTNTDTANFDHGLTMERLLQRAGYRTAYVGKFLNGWQNSAPPPFFDNRSLVGGGYANQWFNVDGISRQVPYTTDFIGEQSVSYLEQFESSDSQPWMLIAATPAPHNPWEPSPEHANDDVGTWTGNPATQESDRSDKPPWVQSRNFSLTQAEAVRVPQLRTLRSVDDMVDTVMTRLQQLGELSDTLVIYTSDNGYLWSEHHLGGDFGTAAQKRYPYASSVKLPFLIRWDGHVAAGTTDQRLAGMVDVVPTVLDAAGVTGDYALDGYSLLTSHARTRIILEYWLDPGDATIPTWVSVRTANLMFVQYYDALGNVSFREYYDLAADPWELVNLLNDGNPSNPDIGPLQTYATSGATCAGTTSSMPVPANPCP